MADKPIGLSEILSVHGNAVDGGGAGVFVDATLDSLDKIVPYVYQSRLQIWAEKNRQMAENSAKAAAGFQFNYGDLIAGDKAKIDDSIAGFTKWFQEGHSGAATYKVNPDGTTNAAEFNEFRKRKQDIDFLINRGNMRASQKLTYENEMVQAPVEKRDLMKAHLDQQIASPITDNITLFPPTADYSLRESVEGLQKNLLTNGVAQFQDLKVGGDNNYDVSGTILDMSKVLPTIQNSKTYNKDIAMATEAASQLEQKRSEIIKKYPIKDAQGNITGYDKVKAENDLRNDPQFAPFLQSIDNYNKNVDNFNGEITYDGVPGLPKSRRKANEMIGRNPMNKINIEDGISPIEFMQIMVGGKENAFKVEYKATHTGDATKHSGDVLDLIGKNFKKDKNGMWIKGDTTNNKEAEKYNYPEAMLSAMIDEIGTGKKFSDLSPATQTYLTKIVNYNQEKNDKGVVQKEAVLTDNPNFTTTNLSNLNVTYDRATGEFRASDRDRNAPSPAQVGSMMYNEQGQDINFGNYQDVGQRVLTGVSQKLSGTDIKASAIRKELFVDPNAVKPAVSEKKVSGINWGN